MRLWPTGTVPQSTGLAFACHYQLRNDRRPHDPHRRRTHDHRRATSLTTAAADADPRDADRMTTAAPTADTAAADHDHAADDRMTAATAARMTTATADRLAATANDHRPLRGLTAAAGR